jgi:hypothetical protein
LVSLGILILVEVNNGDVRAFARVQHRHRAADAGVAAGDDRHLAGQLAAAAVVRRHELRFLLQLRFQPRFCDVLGRWRTGIGVLRTGLHRLFALFLDAASRLLLAALVLLVLALLDLALLAGRAWIGPVLRICHGVLLDLFRAPVLAMDGRMTVRLLTYAGQTTEARKKLDDIAKNIANYERYGTLFRETIFINN